MINAPGLREAPDAVNWQIPTRASFAQARVSEAVLLRLITACMHTLRE